MQTLLLQFPGGRYHATPWGSHVNEGLVEWPPSPWRLLRALIATAFTKAHVPDPVPPDHPLRHLVSSLSNRLPTYRLPCGLGTHSRHYMPIGTLSGGREKTALVLDACAVVGDRVLGVTWDVSLDPDARNLLARLAGCLGYIGRAESWVEARLVMDGEPLASELAAAREVVPHTEGRVARPGEEQVALLAPMPADEYAAWRHEAVEAALSELPAPNPDRKPPKSLVQKREKAVEPFPPDLLAALTRDTAWMQAHGWNQPPGSRRVLYWRPADSITTARPAVSPRRRRAEPIEAALLALTSPTVRGDVLPPLSRALPLAERIHRSLVSLAGGGKRIRCPVLVGKDDDDRPLRGHGHVHILPLCLEHEGLDAIDHVLLFAPMGFDSTAQGAIRRLRSTWAKDVAGDIEIAVAGMGSLQDLREAIGRRVVGPSPTWASETPFVPPRHIKSRRHTLVDQVRDELRSRAEWFALADPDLVSIEPMARDDMVQARLHRFVRRRERGPAPPIDVGYGVRLTFPEPVPGPIALGYGSHFGLGRFRVG